MLKWIRSFNEAESETKQFIFCTVCFALIIILSLVYGFFKLDSRRSYETKKEVINRQP